MTVSTNVQPGGSGHAAHHRALAEAVNQLIATFGGVAEAVEAIEGFTSSNDAGTAVILSSGPASRKVLTDTIGAATSDAVGQGRLQGVGRAGFDLACMRAAITRVPLVVIGSSTTAGETAVPVLGRVWSRVEKMLQASFNPAGIAGGYTLRGTDSLWATSGTVNLPVEGLGVWSRSLNAGATMTHVADSSTGLRILHTRGAGSGRFTVKIDNEEPVLVTPSLSGAYRHDGVWDSRVLARGKHTYVITAVDFTVISGTYIYDQDNFCGLHIWNSGAGGATAATFLDKTSLWDRVALIKPVAVPVMLGSNEYAQQISLAQFKSDIGTLIARIRTAAGNGPMPWVPLIGMPERTVTPYPIPYQGYLDVLAQVASENPSFASFHNLAPFFPKTQSTDIYDLIGPDDVHSTDRGNEYQAWKIADAWGLPTKGPRTVTPPAPEPVPVQFARDSFARANGSALGADEKGNTWLYNGGGDAWQITDGRANMASSSGAKYVHVNAPAAEFDWSLDFVHTTGTVIAGISFFYIDAGNRWAFNFDTGLGVLKLEKLDGAATTTRFTMPAVPESGVPVRLRVVVRAGRIRAFLDGSQVADYPMTQAEIEKYGAVVRLGIRKGAVPGAIDNTEGWYWPAP